MDRSGKDTHTHTQMCSDTDSWERVSSDYLGKLTSMDGMKDAPRKADSFSLCVQLSFPKSTE